jgi:hypothetical protein
MTEVAYDILFYLTLSAASTALEFNRDKACMIIVILGKRNQSDRYALISRYTKRHKTNLKEEVKHQNFVYTLDYQDCRIGHGQTLPDLQI